MGINYLKTISKKPSPRFLVFLSALNSHVDVVFCPAHNYEGCHRGEKE
jgi:hypothetical protein